MDSGTIREKLKPIIEQSDKCGFTAYLVVKEEPRLKKMMLEKDGLRVHLKDCMIGVIKNRYLADDATYTQAENVADNQFKFYIINQNEIYHPFNVDLWNCEDFKETDLSDFMGFIFAFRYDEQVVWCYQNKRSITVPNRKNTGIFTRLKHFEGGVIFEEQIDNPVKIEHAIDALIIDNQIITSDIKLFERSFDFLDFIEEKSRSVVSSVLSTGYFNDNGKMIEYLSRGGGREKRYHKRMMRAIDSPVLSMTAEALFEKIQTVDRWKGKFKEPVDGKIPIDTFKEVESLIDLLDERYTKSEITGQEYDTDVKKKADEENSEGETPQ